jgi:hypothetical protein
VADGQDRHAAGRPGDLIQRVLLHGWDEVLRDERLGGIGSDLTSIMMNRPKMSQATKSILGWPPYILPSGAL